MKSHRLQPDQLRDARSAYWAASAWATSKPAFILLYQPLRRNDRALALGLGMIVFGLIVNRWNVTLSGLVAPPDRSPGVLGNIVAARYTSSSIEVLVALGIVAYALLGFTLGARFLPIYRPRSTHTPSGD